MIVYPAENYNSFISLNDAITYFGSRLNSASFSSADTSTKEAALVTAFRALNELDITIDPTVSEQLTALKHAQCEQALYELIFDLESKFNFIKQSSKISVTKKEMPRYSERALATIRPYLQGNAVSIIR